MASMENPPRKKKVEDFAPTDLSGEVLERPKLEVVEKEEVPFIQTESTLEKLNSETPGEFRKNLSDLFEQFKGLKAVSGTEARGGTPKRGRIALESIGELDHNPVQGLNLEGKYEGKPDAANENGESVAPEVPKFMKLADKFGVGKERTSMQAAEAEYLSKYKEFHKKNSVLGRLGKDISNHADSKQLEALKKKYDESRLEYSKAISSTGKNAELAPSPAFKARMEARYAKMIEAGETPKDYFNKPLSLEQYVETENAKRNESLAKYATFREVIKPAAEKKITARAEALDAKGKNVFEKGLGWFAKANHALESKVGKTGARAIRAVSGAVLVTGGAALAGSVGTGALLGLAGYGAFKAGKSFAGAMIGATVGEAAGSAYVKLRGKSEQQKAKKSLKGLGKNSDVTLESLAALDSKREKLIGRADERTLENKKNLIKGLVAFGVGAGTAASLAEISSLQHASHVVGGLGAEKFGHMPSHEEMTQLAHGDKNAHYFYENRPNASAGHELPGKPAPAPGSESVDVNGNVHTSDQLLGHFAEKLQKDFAGVASEHTPKSVSTFHDLFVTKPGASLLQGENHASLELGLRGHHGLSEIMHQGDTIKLNEQGQIVINWADHARPQHVLIDSEGGVNYDVDDLQGAGHMSGLHHAHATTHHEAPKVTPAATPEVVQPEPTPVESAPTPAPEAAPEHNDVPETHPEPASVEHAPDAPVAPSVPEIPHNHFDVPINPNESHLYEMKDASTGETSLAFYGDDKAHDVFFQKLEDAARANPGKTIYFDSPAPTTATGTPQPWVNSVKFTPGENFSIPLTPSDESWVGGTLNAEQFVRIIN